jgi:hypothetical protein
MNKKAESRVFKTTEQITDFWKTKKEEVEKACPGREKIIDGCAACSSIVNNIISAFCVQATIDKNIGYKICAWCNIKSKHLVAFLNGKRNLDLFTVCKIAAMLDLEIISKDDTEKVFDI